MELFEGADIGGVEALSEEHRMLSGPAGAEFL
jgi:hypothetical protein